MGLTQSDIQSRPQAGLDKPSSNPAEAFQGRVNIQRVNDQKWLAKAMANNTLLAQNVMEGLVEGLMAPSFMITTKLRSKTTKGWRTLPDSSVLLDTVTRPS